MTTATELLQKLGHVSTTEAPVEETVAPATEAETYTVSTPLGDLTATDESFGAALSSIVTELENMVKQLKKSPDKKDKDLASELQKLLKRHLQTVKL